MTTGSRTTGTFTQEPYYNVSGIAQAGLWSVGAQTVKTWSGGDAKSTKVVATSYIRKGLTYSREKVVSVPYNASKSGKTYLPPQNYECTITRRVIPAGLSYWQTRYTVSGALYSYSYWSNFTLALVCSGNLPPLPTFPSNKWNAMLLKLKEKSQGSDFNMAVFLGEGHQTLRLIGDTAIALAEAYRMVRKGRPHDAFRILAERSTAHGRRLRKPKFSKTSGTVGSHWLELQYGWVPLLSDVKSAAELLAHRLNVPFVQRCVVRDTVETVHPATYNDSWPTAPNDTTMIFKKAIGSVSKQIIAYFKESSSLPALSGILDPELVAWELVPFSFVVDWFIPIGNYLEARAYSSRLSGTFVTTTVEYQHLSGADWFKLNYTSNGGSLTNQCMVNTFSKGYINEKRKVSRVVSSTLQAELPSFKPLSKAASWQHCANALALIATSFSKR